jgi:GGDEF domain-containing protein
MTDCRPGLVADGSYRLLAGADNDIANLVRRADVAVYRSKREGRDRVTVV